MIHHDGRGLLERDVEWHGNVLHCRRLRHRLCFIVNQVNDGPVLAGIADRTINELGLLTITNSATDVDLPSQTLTYSLTNAPTGMSINSVSGVLTWTPTEAQGPSTNLIRVIVRDNGSPSLSATQAFTVVVNEVNKAPVLVNPGTLTIDETIRFTNQQVLWPH